MPHGLDRAETHASRSACGEDAIDQLFPETLVPCFVPYGAKLCQTRANHLAARAMRSANGFNRDGCSIQTLRGRLSTMGILWARFSRCQRTYLHKSCAFIHTHGSCIPTGRLLHRIQVCVLRLSLQKFMDAVLRVTVLYYSSPETFL